MDVLVTDLLIETLLISITFSIFEMALVQKIKTLSGYYCCNCKFLNDNYHLKDEIGLCYKTFVKIYK